MGLGLRGPNGVHVILGGTMPLKKNAEQERMMHSPEKDGELSWELCTCSSENWFQTQLIEMHDKGKTTHSVY